MTVTSHSGVIHTTTPVNDVNQTYDLELLGVVFNGDNEPLFTPDNSNETNFYLDNVTNNVWYWDILNQVWVLPEGGLHAGVGHYGVNTFTGNNAWESVAFHVNSPNDPIPRQWGDIESFYSGGWYSIFDALTIPSDGVYLCSSWLSVYIPEPGSTPTENINNTVVDFRLVVNSGLGTQKVITIESIRWGDLWLTRMVSLTGHTVLHTGDVLQLEVRFNNTNFQIYTQQPVTGVFELGDGLSYIQISKLI